VNNYDIVAEASNLIEDQLGMLETLTEARKYRWTSRAASSAAALPAVKRTTTP